ncbi:MAG: TRAP transporter small permease [Firmicutes bacterium]|nr:TRAP transporter small permease [Bacillota bacterium]
MAVLKGLKAFNKGVAKVYEVICTVLLGVMCLLAVVEVVRRYVFHVSFMWSDEALRYMSVWITFFGGALVFRKASMTVFDLFIGKLPPKKREIADLVVLIISFAFLIFIFIKAAQYSFSGPVVREISSGTHISMLVPYISMPCGFGAMLLFGIEQIIDKVIALRGKEEKE